MKAILVLVVCSISFGVNGQCDVSAALLNVGEPVCFGDNFVFQNNTVIDCADADSVTYVLEFSTGEIQTESVGFPFIGSLIQYSTTELSLSVCLTVTAFNDLGNELASDEYCSGTFFQPAPLQANVIYPDECIECFALNIEGGAPSYTLEPQFEFFMDQNGLYCAVEEGVVQIGIEDANGCYAEIPLVIDFSDNPPNTNGTCATATPLPDGAQIYGTNFCANPTGEIPCMPDYESPNEWIVINSEDYLYLDIGFYNNVWVAGLAVFQEVDGLGCDSLLNVYCTQVDYDICYDVTEDFTLLPNTNYYIQITGGYAWGGTLGYAINLSYEPEETCGCSDPESCNYAPEALVNYCIYPGCTDPDACNYFENAGCDDGSCTYSEINGFVFQDVNGNGAWNGGFTSEPKLANQQIQLLENGMTVFTDYNGEFSFDEIPEGDYTAVWVDSSDVFESNGTFAFSIPGCYDLAIPVTSENEIFANVSTPCCIWMMDIHCQNGFNPGIFVSNTGSVPFNGSVTITCDPLFVAEDLGSAEPISSFVPGIITWNIADQQPGSNATYQCHIVGPGTDYLGQQFLFTLHLILADDEGNVVYDNAWTLEPTVVCAYDPNDKYAADPGYTEEHHFVLAENEIEYRIRFQNTGNAPAEDIVIEDQLDLTTLDLSTFEPVFGSHSFYTTVESDGLVHFVFEDINLPDSTSDEPGSQGYVVFRIKPISTLEGWTEINNTASIFFDNNPPIITNTTWHTIFDCDWIGFDEQNMQSCEGVDFITEFTPLYAEQQTWEVNNVENAIGSSLLLPEMETGLYEIEHIASNPLCTVSSTINLTVNPLPEVFIYIEGNLVIAPDGFANYDWYLMNELLSEEHENELNYGLYIQDVVHVYVIVTDGSGCIGVSNTIIDSAVSSENLSAISLFPNPITETAILKLTPGIFQITLINSLGQRIITWNNIQHQLEIRREGLAAGNYLLRVEDENGKSDEVKLVIE